MNKNYELLFKKMEEESNEFIKAYVNHAYCVLENQKSSFTEENNIPYIEEASLFDKICYIYELNDSKVNNIISKFKEFDIVKDYDVEINKKDIKINISTEKTPIKVIRFAGKYKSIGNNKYYELRNLRNLKKDYKTLIQVSKLLNIDNKIVTGYVYGFSNKVKSVYSWIEFKKNNEEYVIDFYNNLIMNKDAYYYLRHVDKINEISSKTIEEDECLFNEFNNILNFDIQEYLIFRDEIMRDLKKKEYLLK